MQVETQKKVTVVISMSESEAHWLKGYMQNYIGPEYRAEDAEDAKRREQLFDTLLTALGPVKRGA